MSLSTTQLRNCIDFLQRVYVGKADEDRLIATMNAVMLELERTTNEQRKHANRT